MTNQLEKLSEVIVRECAENDPRIKIYDAFGDLIACDIWYKDGILKWGDCYGIAHKFTDNLIQFIIQ